MAGVLAEASQLVAHRSANSVRLAAVGAVARRAAAARPGPGGRATTRSPSLPAAPLRPLLHRLPRRRTATDDRIPEAVFRLRLAGGQQRRRMGREVTGAVPGGLRGRGRQRDRGGRTGISARLVRLGSRSIESPATERVSRRVRVEVRQRERRRRTDAETRRRVAAVDAAADASTSGSADETISGSGWRVERITAGEMMSYGSEVRVRRRRYREFKRSTTGETGSEAGSEATERVRSSALGLVNFRWRWKRRQRARPEPRNVRVLLDVGGSRRG